VISQVKEDCQQIKDIQADIPRNGSQQNSTLIGRSGDPLQRAERHREEEKQLITG
jgi:hypothetical protein